MWCEFTERDTRNLRIFNYWFFSAMFVFAVATLLLDGRFVTGSLAWLLPAVVAILGAGSVRAYFNFLRQADELLRKIHLDALALAFGVTAVFMIVWRLCERAGAPKLDFDDPLLVMMITWGIGQWIGMRRYAAGEAQ